jgi:hypothetical protein
MHVQQIVVHDRAVTEADLAPLAEHSPHLVLLFGGLEAMMTLDVGLLHRAVPTAQWVGCSTAGEISREGVSDNSLVFNAVRFDRPAFRVVGTTLGDMADSQPAGDRLARALAAPELRHVLVLGQGAEINGSALVQGITAALGPEVRVTGGLAGDAGRFTGSRVLGPDGISDRQIVALGFDGPGWQIGHGSFGGWQRFGPVRSVTRSDGNVLYELDDERALDIYKRYLGDYAAQLPASGLLFPWAVLGQDHGAEGLIRTILGVDEAQGSLILAGDIPANGHLQLMQASVDALVDAAEQAAESTLSSIPSGETEPDGEALALLVSCIGRKLVMGGRVEEEVEAVSHVLGRQATVTGFYSNGEISPHLHTMDCSLHNQTMTITLIREVAPSATK